MILRYVLYIYRNYWNRSRPCIILDSKIPRLVLEAFPKELFFGRLFLDQLIKNGPNRAILKDLSFYLYLALLEGPSLLDLY